MRNSRQKVIDFIRSKNSASVFQISQALNITPANARYHVQVLIKQGTLEKVGVSSERVAKRPPGIYSLTSYIHRHNLDRLASSLLVCLLQGKSDEEKQHCLREIAVTMCEKSNHSEGTLNNKLYEAILQLNQMNYSAHWEAHAAMPRIIFKHCPYLPILIEHPELCQLDEQLLHTLCGLTFIQKSRLEKDKSGKTVCVFVTN